MKCNMTDESNLRSDGSRVFCLLVALGLVIAVGSQLVLAQARDPSDSSASQIKEALTRFESGVIERRLSNGLLVLFYPRGDAPVFSGAVGVGVGGADEPVGSTGVAHLLEHMAFKGTRNFGGSDPVREQALLAELEQLVDPSTGQPKDPARWKEINEELQKLWVTESFTREFEKRGSVGLNATTSADLTRYFVSLPREAFEFWSWAESERIINPVMRQFYQERDVVLEERRMRYENDPGGKLYERLISAAFDHHPYRNPVIGYEEDIRKLTASTTEQFQRQYYIASNIVIALAGDVNPERDMPLLERYFGRIPASSEPVQRPTVVEPELKAERRVVVEMQAAPQMYIAYRKPVYPDQSDPALSLLFEILTGSSQSPLYEQLVKKSRIASSVSYFEGPGGSYPNLVIFSLVPRAPHTNAEVLAEFDRVLEQVIRDGITQEQIDIARRGTVMDFIGRLRSNQSIALQLVSTQLVYHDWREMLRWMEKVNAVTSQDMIAVAKRYLVPENRVIAFLESEA